GRGGSGGDADGLEALPVREVHDLADGEGGAWLRPSREVLHEPVHERQIHGLEREIAPVGIERGGPREDTPAAYAPLDQRDRAVVDPRQHVRRIRRRELASAEEPGGREVPAARTREHLEDRMAVLQVPPPPAPSLAALPHLAR